MEIHLQKPLIIWISLPAAAYIYRTRTRQRFGELTTNCNQGTQESLRARFL